MHNNLELGAGLTMLLCFERVSCSPSCRTAGEWFVARALSTEMVLLLRTRLSFSELPHSKRKACDGTLATEKRLLSPPHWRKDISHQSR